MYVLLLLPIVAAQGYLAWRFLYNREVDWRPGAIGLGLLALGALAGELTLPGAWHWLDFAGATPARLGLAWRRLRLLSALVAIAYLFLQRPFRPRKAVTALALGCAALCALQTVVVVGMRIDYPFDLEWIEGGMLDHVVRIKSGAPLYRPPDVDFVPCLYAPLYVRIVALLPYLPGSPYWLGRMVSLLCALSTCALVYYAASAAAKSAWTGLLLALCVLGGAPFVGDWFDTFRVDCLFVFLATSGLVALDRGDGRPRWLCAAGALLAASVFAKQAGAFLVVGALAWSFAAPAPGPAHRARRCAWLSLGGALTTAALTGVEIADSGLQWVPYIIKQLSNYPLTKGYFDTMLHTDLLGAPGVMLLWGAVVGVATIAARDWRSLLKTPFAAGGVALIVIAALQRSKAGGAENCLMPMLVGCLLLAAHGLRHDDDAPGARAMSASYLLLLAAFLWRNDLAGSKLAARAPTNIDLDANRQLLEYLKGQPGPAIAPTRSHLVYQARGETCFHDVFASDWGVLHPYPEKIHEAFKDKRYSAMVLLAGRLLVAPPAVISTIKQNYTCKDNPFDWPAGATLPVVGWRTRPLVFCERNPP